MNQPANNVQLTCASCGQPYLIQAVYQNSPHQCPLCGAMAGGQPMQQPGMPLQQPAMQQPGMQQPGMQQPGMQQPGMQQPGMQQPGMQQPGMQQPGAPMQGPAGYQPAPPGAHPQAGADKSSKARIIFIVRCVVGVIAVVAIIWTLIYVSNRNYNVTVDLGDSSELGKGGALNAGTFDVSPGKTFKAKFKIKAVNGEDLYFQSRQSTMEGATISEDGQFVWEIPEDTESGFYNLNFSLNDRKNPRLREIVKISFNVQ